MRKNTPKRSCSILPKWKKGVKTAAHMYHPSHREYPPRGHFHFVPFLASQGRLWCVLTYDGLNKPKTVKQVWWPSLWFWAIRAVFNCAYVYEFCEVRIRGAQRSILWGHYYSVTMCRLIWGPLLLGKALLIGTLRYLDSFSKPSFP